MNDIEKVTDDITSALATCTVGTLKELSPIKQAIVLAQGMKTLRAALTKEIVESLLMPLQGTSLGFRTDKDKDGGYPWQTVRDCAIEAMIRGFNIVGNEFNIIADRPYYTKEGLDRRVGEFEGLTNLELNPGVPHMVNGGALVPYRASWILKGARMELVRDVIKVGEFTVDQRIPVRVNSGQGADAILGKAKRKLLAQIYDRLTGARISTPDGDVFDTVGETVEEKQEAQPKTVQAVDDLVAKHTAKNGKKAKADAPEPPKEQAAPEPEGRQQGEEG